MAKLLMWNLSCLKTKSREMTGPLPELYLRDLTRMVEELQGVYLSGIQVGDDRRFCIPNPRFKGYPILYNPKIIEQYDPIHSEGEGCLSFPGLWVNIPRFKYVTIVYRDSQWKEVKATFGSEDPSTEESLLAKAIQHEIFHMDGIVLHERIQDPMKRVKALAKVMKASIEQNRTKGVPKLVNGPAELDPNSLPIVSIHESNTPSAEVVQQIDNSSETTIGKLEDEGEELS